MNPDLPNQPRSVDAAAMAATSPTTDTAAPAAEGDKKRWWLIPAGIGLVVLGGVGWGAFSVFSKLSQLGPPPSGPQPVDVETIEAPTAQIADASEFVANLESRQAVTLRPRVSGQISQIYVNAGDRVEAGAPLIQIDPTELEAELSTREADVASARASLDSARADLANARDQLGALEAQRQSDLAILENARANAERDRQLVAEGAIDRRTADDSATALKTAQASLRATEANIQAQRSVISRAQAAIVRNQGQVQAAQSSANAQATRLNFYTINAPFSGFVGDIPVKVGDFVSTSTDLAVVAQNATLEVEINVPVEDAPRLRSGLPVELLDSKGNRLVLGKISFISPTVNAQTQSVLIKATFSNPKGQLRAAQFVRARVIWEQRAGVAVPTSAIARIGGQNFVFVTGDYDQAKCDDQEAQFEAGRTVAYQVPVTLGQIKNNQQEVMTGLQPGEEIIVSGIINLNNCAPVNPTARSSADSPAQSANPSANP